jgi:hypothetical protein
MNLVKSLRFMGFMMKLSGNMVMLIPGNTALMYSITYHLELLLIAKFFVFMEVLVQSLKLLIKSEQLVNL